MRSDFFFWNRQLYHVGWLVAPTSGMAITWANYEFVWHVEKDTWVVPLPQHIRDLVRIWSLTEYAMTCDEFLTKTTGVETVDRDCPTPAYVNCGV